MLIKNVSTPKKINLGIQILRMICCLIVIHRHFYSYYSKILNNYIYAMMLFFFISYYFSYTTLSSRNNSKIKERLKRILIPYIGWPLIFFIYDKLWHKKSEYKFKNLYYQIILGCGIYGIFWFLFNVILLSLFIILINYLFKKSSILILFIICIFDYLFFYSGYADIIIFNKFKKVPVRHSIKPIFKFFIFIFSGYYSCSKNLIKKLYKYRIETIIFSFVFIFIFIRNYYYIFSKISFFYEGIVQNIFIFNIFIFFAMIPFDKVRNKYLILVLNKITGYTGGIYYLHVKMGDSYLKYIHSKIDFKGCLLIYLFCYLICLLGNIILNRSNLKYLLI